MRLISLTANAESFHPVYFRENGPSFIVGRQKKTVTDKSAATAADTSIAEGAGTDPAPTGVVREDAVVPSVSVTVPPRKAVDTHTYNGVGKSLLLYLVNYCLGADPKESFTSQLDSWEFTLQISIEGRRTSIIRKVSEPGLVQFGHEKVSLDEFRSRLQAEVFPDTEEAKFLTLRSLLGSFLRPGKMAYSKWDGIHHSEKPVQRQIRSAFLLGLDVNLVLQKYHLVDELRSMREMSSRFSKDPFIKEYFNGNKDVGLDIRDLEEQLAALETSLSGFKVAENYHDIETEAQELKSQLQSQRNHAVALTANLRQIDESLKAQPSVSVASVREVYEQVKIHFPPSLLRQLSEVEQFHAELLKTRRARLKKERDSHQQRLTAIESRINTLNGELDSKLKFLNDHGALGELLSLKDRSNDIRNRLQKLVDFKTLTKKFKDRSSDLQVELATANVEALRYLDAHQSTVIDAGETFRRFTKRIYPGKQSGLTIENDEGETQTRFKIDAKIIADASDGINEAKIFAYDLTVAALRRNHQVRFLCHDSRLFSDIDPRQRAEIFRLAADISTECEFQYIATVNQDQIEAVREILGEADFERIIVKNTVLELKDDAPEDKLLGIEVDVSYD